MVDIPQCFQDLPFERPLLERERARSEDTLGMPEPELFEVIFEKRLELIAWLEQVGRNLESGRFFSII